MKYKVKQSGAQVWGNVRLWIPSGKRDMLGPGLIIEDVGGKYGYIKIDHPVRGYVSTVYLEPVDESVPPAIDETSDIRRTIRGDCKPKGYKPEGINYGSFDIGWLLDKPKISKPAPLKISDTVMDYVRWLNHSGDQQVEEQKIKWLVAQENNSKVMKIDAKGQYSIPVPCWSGNNLVRVLDKKGMFARIETVNIYKPLPVTLAPWLVHVWWAFDKGGKKYYQPLASLGGVRYPLLWRGDSAWIQLKEIGK